jgi:non-heme chloroperoxidase
LNNFTTFAHERTVPLEIRHDRQAISARVRRWRPAAPIRLPIRLTAAARGMTEGPDHERFTTRDGTQIYYKDWGSGPVVSFSHGWPLSADAWEAQMFHLAATASLHRARPARPRPLEPALGGNDMDTYADDLNELFTALDLKDVTMIGHSTGGGEVARYIGRHGTQRVAGGADGRGAADHGEDRANPAAADRGVRRLPQGLPGRPLAVLPGRRQRPLLRLQPAGAKVSQGLIQSWWMQGMLTGTRTPTTASRPSRRPTSPRT